MPRFKVQFVVGEVDGQDIPQAIIEAADQLRDLSKAPLPGSLESFHFNIGDVLDLDVEKI